MSTSILSPIKASEKIVFVIPGYKHRPKNKAYKEIAKILKSEGYSPILIRIPWKQTTISENTEYFLKKYQEHLLHSNKKLPPQKIYILGFSFGAMIALIAATKVRVTGLILCSLSPYFKEDLPKINTAKLSVITKRRHQDFSGLHSAALAKQIKIKQIHMLYGKKESTSLIKRVTGTFRQISCAHKYLISIKDTAHDIGSKKYLHHIHQTAKALT